MSTNSLAGWALILAVVVGFIASILTPGGLIIDPVDTNNFEEAAVVLGDNSEIAQWMTFLLVVSVVLYWFGLNSLRRAFSSGSSMDKLSRFALNVFLLGYAFLIIELGIRHILTHILAHGVGGSPAEEKTMAITLFAAAAGIHLAFLYVAAIGSMIFGYGLVRRCAGISIFRLASLGMALTGLGSFIVLMIAEHVPAIDLHGIALASNAVLLFGSLCILVIGIGIIQGRREFVGDKAAA